MLSNYRQRVIRNVTQPIQWMLGLLSLLVPISGQVDLRWRDVTSEMGIHLPARLPPSRYHPLPEAFSGQSVPFDFDQDGDLDLLFTYGPLVSDSLYSGLNQLYRQDDTGWVDVTAETDLARYPPASSAAVGDYNGDNFLDLYLCLFGSDLLLRNEGGLLWSNVTDSMGLRNDKWATEAVFFDANLDGYLDLYVANYLEYPSKDTIQCVDPFTKQLTYCDPLLYDPAPNRLFINDSARGFFEATEAMGLTDSTSRSLGVKLLDANVDGRLDLFVLSDRSPNLLYLANSDTGFIEAGLVAGVALAPDGSEPEWQEVQILDANQDAYPDMLFTRRDGELLLQLNNGRGLFFPGHYQTGLFHPRFPYRATAVAVADLDFNGTTDLLLADVIDKPQRRAVHDAVVIDTISATQESLDTKPGPSSQRVLLSDRTHHFQPVEIGGSLVLDTTMLMPRTVVAVIDTGFDLMSVDVSGPLFFFPDPEEESSGSPPSDISDESVSSDNVDSLPIDPMAVMVDGISGYAGMDTLKVYQGARKYTIIDLTGDGVGEVLATYPVGLSKIWMREVRKSPRFIGLWPRTVRAGTTVVGAEVRIEADDLIRRFIVTDPNPILLYFPRRLRSVDVMVRWPDGVENTYRTSLLNRIYTLTRTEVDSEPHNGR